MNPPLYNEQRCASRQRDEGVDEVGAAAARWENGADREKGRVEQWERENTAGDCCLLSGFEQRCSQPRAPKSNMIFWMMTKQPTAHERPL
ncbi:unnamed protein product [Pleuronectes platessa]|uniref:Uncharacterized protein n=1 Tax=Pleuronectes platessa TaxID=8262 RepID=A0A9N7YAN2_PLEPL|nr:unnamed protein product [Pleuronectes platessa]